MEQLLIKIASIALATGFALFIIGAFTNDDSTIILGFFGVVIFIACALIHFMEDYFKSKR